MAQLTVQGVARALSQPLPLSSRHALHNWLAVRGLTYTNGHVLPRNRAFVGAPAGDIGSQFESGETGPSNGGPAPSGGDTNVVQSGDVTPLQPPIPQSVIDQINADADCAVKGGTMVNGVCVIPGPAPMAPPQPQVQPSVGPAVAPIVNTPTSDLAGGTSKATIALVAGGVILGGLLLASSSKGGKKGKKGRR